jgi:hypothetical protein
MRIDRRIGDVKSLYDATASALRVPPRMRVREENNDTQLRVGELLIMNIPALEYRIVRLPDLDSSAIGIVSRVKVYGYGCVQLVAPPGYMVNGTTDATVYINSRGGAEVILERKGGYGIRIDNYVERTRNATSTDIDLTTDYADIIDAAKNSVIIYPQEWIHLSAYVEYYSSDATMVRGSFQIYNNTTSTAVRVVSDTATEINYHTVAWSHSADSPLENSYPLGVSEFTIQGKETGASADLKSTWVELNILQGHK